LRLTEHVILHKNYSLLDLVKNNEEIIVSKELAMQFWESWRDLYAWCDTVANANCEYKSNEFYIRKKI